MTPTPAASPLFVFGLAKDPPAPAAAPVAAPLFAPAVGQTQPSLFAFGKPAAPGGAAPAVAAAAEKEGPEAAPVFVFGQASTRDAAAAQSEPPAVPFKHVQSRLRNARKDRKRHIVRSGLGGVCFPATPQAWAGYGAAADASEGDPRLASPGLSACSDPAQLYEEAEAEDPDDDEEDLTEDCRLALEKARSFASRHSFGAALKECMSAMSGPPAVVKLARGVCDAWERADRERALRAEEQQNSLMAQLMAARDRADELRRVMREKESQLQKDLNLAEQSRELRRVLKEKEAHLLRAEARRRETEAEVLQLRRRLQCSEDTAQENVRLRRELSKPKAPSRDELVRQVAALECLSLKRVGPSERVAMKKKLLLKWHPDKQASTENAPFATQVMQELQNRPEWD